MSQKTLGRGRSCFAQHIGNALQAHGFNWLETEPAPYRLKETIAKKFNYGIFSCRTGNIYTASQLKQWVSWSLREAMPSEEIWQKRDRYCDPFRPRIELCGFSSGEELLASRSLTLDSFSATIGQFDIFVFTLGLTESWINAEQGFEYAACPGTLGGEFDPEVHKFKNQNYSYILAELKAAIDMMRSHNKELKILLTVSPVPLTATASKRHVLVATMHSKSILRLVAGELSSEFDYIDYFSSYEIITSPAYRGMFYEPNVRSVNDSDQLMITAWRM